jgi:hypothetical protein
VKTKRKTDSEFTVAVCGDSERNYPRDLTIREALSRIPGVKMIDFTYRLDGGANRWFRGTRVASAWKGVERRRILRRVGALVEQGRIDALLLMKNNPSMFSAVRKIAEPAGVPTIYDLWVSRVLSAQRDGLQTSPQAQQEREIAIRSEWLLATTEPYRSFYAGVHGCPPEKIMVAPLAVTDDWTAPPARHREAGRFVVAYWGSYLKQHGVGVALDAARLLEHDNGIAFRFFGDRPGDLLSSTGATPPRNVEFVPRIANRAELIRAIDGIDLGFGHLQLIHDAHLMLPNKAMEGMARGRVVVHVSSPELNPLYDGSRGVSGSVSFYDGSPEGLAGKIRFFRDNTAFAAAMGENARKCIQRSHSIDHLAAAFAAAIPSLGRSRAQRAIHRSA